MEMSMSLRCRAALNALAWMLGLFGTAAAALAADYPTRPIAVLIPFATGGATQALSERVGREIARELGQPLVSDHRGGAGGTIAAEAAARAAPDGYTLLMGATGALAVAPAVMKSVRFNPISDFQAIALIATTPYVVVVNAKLPVKNMRELIEYGKQNPGKLNFASSGTGGADHIAGEVLQKMAGFKMTHVPYKGAGPYLPDLVSGRIDVAIISPIPIKPFVDAGQVRLLAVTTAQRSPAPSLKDIPTIAEQGTPGYNMLAWYGYFAPARTPPDIIARLHAATSKALAEKENEAWLLAQGLAPGNLSSAEFGSFVNGETRKWAEYARSIGVTLE
jgi:tripartite-type tricarboxylate transporter receptor subunit TctC